jgi:hypothetical protein
MSKQCAKCETLDSKPKGGQWAGCARMKKNDIESITLFGDTFAEFKDKSGRTYCFSLLLNEIAQLVRWANFNNIHIIRT